MAKSVKPVDGRFASPRAIRLPKTADLNEREIEVLTLVALGRTSAQIAHKLKLVKRTVDFHVNNARMKLRAGNRTEAATRAVAARLIEPYGCD
jgi:DNA-binding CsgD family transcriptional regulator